MTAVNFLLSFKVALFRVLSLTFSTSLFLYPPPLPMSSVLLGLLLPLGFQGPPNHLSHLHRWLGEHLYFLVLFLPLVTF